MDVMIEKVDINNEDVLDFIALEYLNMIIDINPNIKDMYSGGINNKLINEFVSDYKERFIRSDTVIYIAIFDDEVVGALQFDNGNHISCLFVKEGYRNHRIGSKLLERLISECSRNSIIKVDARIDAISLYESFSFKKTIDTDKRTFIPMKLEMKKYGK